MPLFIGPSGERHLLKTIPSANGVTKQPTYRVSCTCGWKSWKDESVPYDVKEHDSRAVLSEQQAQQLVVTHCLRTLPQRYTSSGYLINGEVVTSETGKIDYNS